MSEHRVTSIRQLSSGYWHIRGEGPCNWSQPPCWPCDEATLRAHTFGEACEEFIRAALAEARLATRGGRVRLTHAYHGPARPIGAGGAMDYSVEPVTISGTFRVDDFQDGVGLKLSNGESPEKSWLVARKNMRAVIPLTEDQPPGEAA